jgi:hypothetical protein
MTIYQLSKMPAQWQPAEVESCFICGRRRRVAPVYPTIFMLTAVDDDIRAIKSPSGARLVCRRCVLRAGDRLARCTEEELARIRAERLEQDRREKFQYPR